MEAYISVRPQALTERNIKSGFRKAGLVPFNPKVALEQLPAPPATPEPEPAVEQQIFTPKNQQDIQKLLEATGSVLQDAMKKLGRAATLFHARALLAEKECKELFEENRKMQAAASRKRKRVPNNGIMSIGEVLESLEQWKGGGLKPLSGEHRSNHSAAHHRMRWK